LADIQLVEYLEGVEKGLPHQNPYNGPVDREKKAANRRAAKHLKNAKQSAAIEEFRALDAEKEDLKSRRTVSLD
jgi:hypothetical protein